MGHSWWILLGGILIVAVLLAHDFTVLHYGANALKRCNIVQRITRDGDHVSVIQLKAIACLPFEYYR